MQHVFTLPYPNRDGSYGSNRASWYRRVHLMVLTSCLIFDTRFIGNGDPIIEFERAHVQFGVQEPVVDGDILKYGTTEARRHNASQLQFLQYPSPPATVTET